MPIIRLIHWKAEEAVEKAGILEEAGFDVCSDLPTGGPRFFKELEMQKPDAIVIDISRIPSQGRDIALTIRMRKNIRHIPILFVGGDDARVEQIRALLPDVTYTRWNEIVGALRQAIKAGAEDVVVPESVFAAYTGKPLAVKLGIKTGSRVAHISSPQGFAVALSELPAGSVLTTSLENHIDLVVWFVCSLEQFDADLESIVEAAKKAPTWIAWPKKGSTFEVDLTQQIVRKKAMSAGLVDYKICSIDKNWSALLFTYRGIL